MLKFLKHWLGLDNVVTKDEMSKLKNETEALLRSSKTLLNTCNVSNLETESKVKRLALEINDKIEDIRKHVKSTGSLPEQRIIVEVDKVAKEIKGVTHSKFNQVLQYVSRKVPVMLVGAAGSGKNVICKQVAEALGLTFYFTNAVTQEYKLTGFIDGNGLFHETEFYKAFKNGGLFFLDEIDGSIPEVLIILNAAIANRYFEFPNGRIDAHPDFRVIAAANTFGEGANNIYTGRYQLDGASLDRFTCININYDINIERVVTNNNSDLIEFCHGFRNIVNQAGINWIFSYRALSVITVMENVINLRELLEEALVKGVPKDSLKTVQGKIGNMPKSRYTIAFCQIK